MKDRNLNSYRRRSQTKATKAEVNAALKLLELLYLKGEIPHHVYRNIVADYYGQGSDIQSTSCYDIADTRKDAV